MANLITIPAVLFLLFNTVAVQANFALVIDDVGYRASDSDLLNLPNAVTLSILPHTPYGKLIAEKASISGREIMLHLPMENTAGIKHEPGTILSSMSQQQIENNIQAAFLDLPFVAGVNNHMGSKLTKLAEPMGTIMSVLKKHQVYFLDSRTTPSSKAYQVAKAHGVKAYRRHIFLDHQKDPKQIKAQLNKALRLASEFDYIIAIGHPYPETIQVLTEFFKTQQGKALQLKKVSELAIES